MINTTFADYAQGKQTLSLPALPRHKKPLALPAYHWCLIAAMSVGLPHLLESPWWLIGLLIISIIAQKTALKMRYAQKGQKRLKRIYRTMQILVFVIASLGVWLSHGQRFGVDVAVGFLLICFIAKSWELYQRRDAYILLNLSLFVLASSFLMNQGLGMVLLGLPSLMMILFAFIAISDETNTDGVGRMRALGVLCLPAIPLLVVLFLFFPRLPPLWVMPMAGKTATTGVSDSMSPGDFANLSKSTELAFRVEFEDVRPSRNQMYWRGLVFSEFDGIVWKQNDFLLGYWMQQEVGEPPAWTTGAYVGREHRYQVTLEPTEQSWLFTLDYPRLQPERGTGMTSDFTLRSYYPVSTQLRYRSSYYDRARINVDLDDYQKRINLRLPEQGNEKSRVFAQTLFEDSNQDPVRYIQAVQQYITTGDYHYTLSPPLLQGDRVDAFLFESKAGFCEHYASSFAFLMRAVGVPARVVVGYQGGELGRDGGSWEVRQMDAHAWTEVWLEDQGWVRIDPTSFVSPERIDDGMSAFTDASGSQAFGDGVSAMLNYQQFKMLQTLRRLSDQASYYWQKDIVGYDQDEQKRSLFKWFNIDSLSEQLRFLIIGVLVFVFVFISWVSYRRKKRYHPLDLPLVLLSVHLAKQDKTLAIATHEPYLTWLARINNELGWDVKKSAIVSALQQRYRKYRYGPDDGGKAAVADITALTKKLMQKQK